MKPFACCIPRAGQNNDIELEIRCNYVCCSPETESSLLRRLSSRFFRRNQCPDKCQQTVKEDSPKMVRKSVGVQSTQTTKAEIPTPKIHGSKD